MQLVSFIFCYFYRRPTDNVMKNNKLEAYLGLAGSVLGAGALHGQVIYTDFNPDVVLDLNNSPVSFMLDIDQDGVNDIEIVGYSLDSMNSNTSTFTTFWSTTYNGNTYFYTYTYTYWSVRRQHTRFWEAHGLSPQKRMAEGPFNIYGSHQTFNAGDTISGSWQEGFQQNGWLYFNSYYSFSSNYSSSVYYAFRGNWLTGPTHFLGVELEKNGQMHYGWVRITRNSDDQLTIHDMAISDVPNVPILAGDTTVSNPAGLDDRRNALLRLAKGPDKLMIKSMPLISDFKVLIANTAGQTVWTGEGKPGETIEVSLIDWPQGTYVVLVTTRKGRVKRWKFVH